MGMEFPFARLTADDSCLAKIVSMLTGAECSYEPHDIQISGFGRPA
jgi:hypothetical protein